MNKQKQAEVDKIKEQSFLDRKYKSMALNIFIWEGLPYPDIPGSLTSDIIERFLYEHGQALFFNDSKLGFMCLPFNIAGGYNVYHQPIKYQAIGHNYNEPYDIENAVIIKNDFLCQPTYDAVMYYVKKIENLEKAIEMNINANKTPFVFTGYEKVLESMKKEYEQITGNVPVLYKNPGAGEAEYTANALNLGVEFRAREMYDLKRDYENELLTYLGIDNSPVDKRERVQTAEVESNAESINTNFEKMYKSRQLAAEQINKMFPELKISVRLNMDIMNDEEEEIEEPENNPEDGGKE